MIGPSLTEFIDTYTCILFKLTSYLGDKGVIWEFSLFYNDLLNILLNTLCFWIRYMPWYYHWLIEDNTILECPMIFSISLIRHSRYKIT